MLFLRSRAFSAVLALASGCMFRWQLLATYLGQHEAPGFRARSRASMRLSSWERREDAGPSGFGITLTRLPEGCRASTPAAGDSESWREIQVLQDPHAVIDSLPA